MSRIRRSAGPVVTAVTLGIVLWRLGTGPFLAGLKSVDTGAVLEAAGVVLATTVFSAWRWTIVARGLGVRLTLRHAVSAYYRAIFLNLALPGGVAGDVHRGFSHGREVHDVGHAVRAVFWERAAGQIVQVVLAISLLLVLPSPVRSSMPFVAAATAALALGFVLVARTRAEGGGSRWRRIRAAAVTDIRDGVLRRDALPAVVLASAVVFAGHAVTFFIAARAAGATAPFSRLLPLVLVAVLATTLPNVAGWGPREGATAWVFGAAGLGAGRGAATAVTFGVLILAASLPGAVVLVAERLPRRGHRSVLQPKGAAHG